MQYLRLGHTGVKVSRLCLGMMSYGSPEWRDWVLDLDQSRPIVREAVELGINFFDTADIYSLGESERVTSRLLKEFFSVRDEFVLATKVGLKMGPGPNQRGLSRKHILASIEASLRRLNLDYVDLFQIHRWDPETPIEETMQALSDVVRSGKARYIGASSMWTWQFMKAQQAAELSGGVRFIAMQNHYNMVAREEEREMIPYCLDQGIAIIPWSPLARGFLAANRTPEHSGDTDRSKSDSIAHGYYYSKADWAVLKEVKKLAALLGVSPAQVSLAWLLHKPGVTCPIIGATKPGQFQELLAATEIVLSKDQMAGLEAPYLTKLPLELN